MKHNIYISLHFNYNTLKNISVVCLLFFDNAIIGIIAEARGNNTMNV
jgi:hypothetical protein